MAGNAPRGDDDLTDLPWASVFDPAANARALSAIQAQGFRAASDLVDRFAEIARHASGGEPVAGAARIPKGLDPDVDAVISTWWTLIGRMFRAMRGEAAEGHGHGASIDIATDLATGRVCLSAGGPSVELWLHNSGTRDADDVAPRCSDLLAHDGTVISSVNVTFTPSTMPLPGRSGRGVRVGIGAAGAAPGRYRGTILLGGHPDVWLPVEVTVDSPAS